MNDLELEYLDLIESTLGDLCYFMSGRVPAAVAHRSLPPPVLGALERRRLASFRTISDKTTSDEYALHWASWNRLPPPETTAPGGLEGYESSASDRTCGDGRKRRHPHIVHGAGPPYRDPSAGCPTKASRKQPVRSCRQCGKGANECVGAKHAKGASQRCSFQCGTCGFGPLLCPCTSKPPPSASTSKTTARAVRRPPNGPRNPPNGVLDRSSNNQSSQGGGGRSSRKTVAPAPRRPRTCRNCGQTTQVCNGGKGGVVGGAENCQFKCLRCGAGPLFCECGGKENAPPVRPSRPYG